MTVDSSSTTASSASSQSPSSSPPTSVLATPELEPASLPTVAHDDPTLKRKRIRSVLMRAGTSKGLFFRYDDLPPNRDQWSSIILSAMGSPDSTGRQLNGLGGGASTTSKVAVVGPSQHPQADVDYLFIQGDGYPCTGKLTIVPVNGTALDFSGNCGNIASGVGPFAVE